MQQQEGVAAQSSTIALSNTEQQQGVANNTSTLVTDGPGTPDINQQTLNSSGQEGKTSITNQVKPISSEITAILQPYLDRITQLSDQVDKLNFQNQQIISWTKTNGFQRENTLQNLTQPVLQQQKVPPPTVKQNATFVNIGTSKINNADYNNTNNFQVQSWAELVQKNLHKQINNNVSQVQQDTTLVNQQKREAQYTVDIGSWHHSHDIVEYQTLSPDHVETKLREKNQKHVILKFNSMSGPITVQHAEECIIPLVDQLDLELEGFELEPLGKFKFQGSAYRFLIKFSQLHFAELIRDAYYKCKQGGIQLAFTLDFDVTPWQYKLRSMIRQQFENFCKVKGTHRWPIQPRLVFSLCNPSVIIGQQKVTLQTFRQQLASVHSQYPIQFNAISFTQNSEPASPVSAASNLSYMSLPNKRKSENKIIEHLRKTNKLYVKESDQVMKDNKKRSAKNQLTNLDQVSTTPRMERTSPSNTNAARKLSYPKNNQSSSKNTQGSPIFEVMDTEFAFQKAQQTQTPAHVDLTKEKTLGAGKQSHVTISQSESQFNENLAEMMPQWEQDAQNAQQQNTNNHGL